MTMGQGRDKGREETTTIRKLWVALKMVKTAAVEMVGSMTTET
jgi:hypothetical protein